MWLCRQSWGRPTCQPLSYRLAWDRHSLSLARRRPQYCCHSSQIRPNSLATAAMHFGDTAKTIHMNAMCVSTDSDWSLSIWKWSISWHCFCLDIAVANNSEYCWDCCWVATPSVHDSAAMVATMCLLPKLHAAVHGFSMVLPGRLHSHRSLWCGLIGLCLRWMGDCKTRKTNENQLFIN